MERKRETAEGSEKEQAQSVFFIVSNTSTLANDSIGAHTVTESARLDVKQLIGSVHNICSHDQFILIYVWQ